MMAVRPFAALLILFAAATPAAAIDNGLGRSPPMGWRGWLLFGTSPTQQKMEAVLPALVSRNRSVGGKPTSLCDLGYCSAGLDNNWNKCQGKVAGAKYAYHYNNGTPAVNCDRFPSMSNMTRLARDLGLTVSWYGNNCGGCREKNATLAMYEGDVAAIGQYGFDGIKLDGCGAEMDLDLWARLINATGRRVMIENCHWGKTLPNKTWCPFNFYRTSGDISVSYASAVKNMLTQLRVDKKAGVSPQDLARPGCYAYA
jgi:alpha-galactosidase